MSAETLWGIARAVLIALLLVILLIRVFEDRMVFFPEPARDSDQTPAQAGVQVEDVFLRSAEMAPFLDEQIDVMRRMLREAGVSVVR